MEEEGTWWVTTEATRRGCRNENPLEDATHVRVVDAFR